MRGDPSGYTELRTALQEMFALGSHTGNQVSLTLCTPCHRTAGSRTSTGAFYPILLHLRVLVDRSRRTEPDLATIEPEDGGHSCVSAIYLPLKMARNRHDLPNGGSDPHILSW